MRSLVLIALAGCAVGCVANQERVDYREPDPTQFPAVANALAPSCATLDCHGQLARNFRFYWANGLRVRADARPGEGATTTDEYASTYRSLIALEPAPLDAVVRGAAPPDSLTLVRKARGTESHKGLAPIAAGSDADRCLTSWLMGTLDTAACARATK
jgi:hypothetical protein